MRAKTIFHLLKIGALVLIIGGCAEPSSPEAEVSDAAVFKLTQAVVGFLRYQTGTNTISEEKLVDEAIKNKPELQHVFKGIPVIVRHNEHDVVLLVCSPDGKYARQEDASWTPFIDRCWYKSNELHQAEFSIPLRQKRE